MMMYVHNDANQSFERVQAETSIYTLKPVPKNYHTNLPTFIISYMEEGIAIKVR